MDNFEYQGVDSHIGIKSKYVNAVEVYYGEKVDRDFLAYIKDFRNINVNATDYSITFYYKRKKYEIPCGLHGEKLEKKCTSNSDEKIANFTVPYGQHYKDKQNVEVEAERKKTLNRVRLAPISFVICFPITILFWVLSIMLLSTMDPSKMTGFIGQAMEGGFAASFFITIAGLIFTIKSKGTSKRIGQIADDLKEQIDKEEEPAMGNLKGLGWHSVLSAIANIISAIISIALFIMFKTL
ncbi:MAG: hypothetical protein IJ400_03210 [Clostridia bacterium]|nr:hypothetical protein [Clostridia bacterium]